jgi:hypothetical protein
MAERKFLFTNKHKKKAMSAAACTAEGELSKECQT